MGKPTGKKTQPVPVRMDEELRTEIRAAAEALHWQDQDVIRLAVKIGLEKLRRVKFDLASAVLDASQKEPGRAREDLALAAEDEAEYRAQKRA